MPDTTITAADLAAIGAAIGAPTPGPVARAIDLTSYLDEAGISALTDASAPTEIDAALASLRERLPADLDDLARATLRETIRSAHPYISAPMVDAAMARPPRRSSAPEARKASQSTRLVDLALDAGVELWHAPTGDPHITIPVDGHREHYALRTRTVREWLARRHHAEIGSVPASQALTDAMHVLGGIAKYERNEFHTAVRVAGHSDRVYVDLGDPSWRAVEIDATGWRVVQDAPVRMVRSRGALALPAPTPGGSIDLLRNVIHVQHDHDHALIVGWMIGALRPTGPYPLLSIVGEQGTRKSTAARVARRLIDPHIAELRAEPRVIDDVMIAAARSRVVALDNLSSIAPWLSDALCRLSTGGALTKRELYTDSDETIIEAIRPTILTAITDVISRGDLLDRTIVVTLPALDERTRLSESELWRRVDTAAPGILGALLDGVSSALARERTTTVSRLPRMADWAIWTTAAEPGLGWAPERILGAYHDMRNVVMEGTLDGDPLAVAIRRLPLPWTGTADELLARLAPTGRAPRGWPESPRGMSAALRRLAPSLRRIGIEITYRREPHTGRRLVQIDHREDSPDQPSPPSPPSPTRDSLAESGDGPGDGRATTAQPSPQPSPRQGSVYRPDDDGDGGDGSMPVSLAGEHYDQHQHGDDDADHARY